MKYFDENGTERSLYASGASRLAFVKEHAPVGRLQTPGNRVWAVQDVRKMEDTGLWDVEWVEPNDDAREGGWIITGLTAFGRIVLDNWNKRQAARNEKE
ncbi:hypothetical protein ACFVXC_05445 [Streptomyces sp. NPDC058257]|uniref:hypothetical protein n=1 Tax=Streptomyces sp. NPDC058257 TaxID=3346409 RepID=UPI0036E2653B